MTTVAEALEAANVARDVGETARREVAGVEGRLGALEGIVAGHRAESQASHAQTQAMVREVADAVAHLKGAADAARPAEPSITLSPSSLPRVARWLGGAAAALGIGGAALHECSVEAPAIEETP